MARSKKPKPSFDVSRTPAGPDATGWVYRSEPSKTRAPAPPAPVATGEGVAPVTHMRGRMASSIDLLTMPLAMALVVVLAPFGFAARRLTR